MLQFESTNLRTLVGLVAMIIVLVFPHQHLVEHVPDTTSASSAGGR